MPIRPTFAYERRCWQQNMTFVAGIDEVGVGALAGPVVAAAVIFPANVQLGDVRLINDSKQLTARQREQAEVWIKQRALAWGIGEASVEEIAVHNIRGASILAMRRAIEWLSAVPELLLVDGVVKNVHPHIPCRAIVKGDSLCVSIAAASILAKVHRDDTMRTLARQHPQYGFEQHKGYGTAQHLKALRQFGPSPHHRLSYSPVAAVLTP